ncbi:MAG: MBL fold metallo-hydrolase [Bacteroidia bacterium]|nr:MBL fold metallo-hydrolase [Bacteroidia bacterium]
MKLKFCGAARTVTGSCHLLTLENNFKILLDCGLYQGHEDLIEDFNSHWKFNPQEINLLVVSHAHIDHIGRIPKLVKDGFTGNIICTHATHDLAAIMLLDSATIQERDAEWANEKNMRKKNGKKNEALYTVEDARACMSQFVGYNYNRWNKIAPGVEVFFTDAGHILGSATVTLKIRKNSEEFTYLGFTGDVGRKARPILKDPVQMPQVDYLISESTYGGQSHDEMPGDLNHFWEVVNTTCNINRGKLIIPAFSVGRTQEIVYMLDHLQSKGQLGKIKVYVDSPLAVNATDIFTVHHECFDNEILEYITINANPFGFNGLKYIRSVEESKKLNDSNEPCIIISASGMANAGRVRHHIYNNIENSDNTILFVGYCAEGTLGAILREYPATVKIFGKELKVKADIKIMDGLSGHADHDELIKFISTQDKKVLKKIFLVHGEYDRQQILREALIKKGYNEVNIPLFGQEYELK